MRTLLLVLGFLISAIAIGSPIPPGHDWEEISSEDGIVVHRREVPGSDLVAFKGETVIQAPIAKVANVLIDTSRKLEWVAKIVEAKNVRETSDFERVEYNHTATPWPLKDRDFVFEAKAEFDLPKKQVAFRMKSVEDPLMPEKNCVRGELKNSVYLLTSLNEGKSTKVYVEIQADPKGSIPKWIVNLFQKSWPRITLEGIRKQVAKPDVQEHPQIKAMFQES